MVEIGIDMCYSYNMNENMDRILIQNLLCELDKQHHTKLYRMYKNHKPTFYEVLNIQLIVFDPSYSTVRRQIKTIGLSPVELYHLMELELL